MNLRYLEVFARRLLSFVLVLFVLSLMIFVLARVVPGDPARMTLGPSATQEQVDQLRTRMGLDQPVLVQYGRYIGNALQGDLGQSIVSGNAVVDDIRSFLPATLELIVITVIIELAFAIPLA